MGIKVTTISTTEPVTLAEVKAWCRVETSDEDALITSILIPAARAIAEQESNRYIAARTVQLALDEFPSGAIDLRASAPVTAIDWVRYIDSAGVQQTIGSSNYALDDWTLTPWLLPAYGYAWPVAREQANALVIQYQAGYGATCPAEIKLAVCKYAAWSYTHRGDSENSDEAVRQEIRNAVQSVWVPVQ
jgi:uncharacterized phiE125 gp8 family phage protein